MRSLCTIPIQCPGVLQRERGVEASAAAASAAQQEALKKKAVEELNALQGKLGLRASSEKVAGKCKV